jgi:[ribosomal protein S5]-alanine N-acetyltransferase
MKERDFSQLQINSQRLNLVPSTEAFSSVTFNEYSGAVARFMYLPPYESEEAAKKALDDGFETMKLGKSISLTLLDRTSGVFIGRVSLLEADTETPELGIWIKESSQKNGYGKEAVETLMDWANDNLDYKYLRYPVDRRNPGSIKLAESFGGIIGKEYKTKNWAGELDDVEYWIYKK